MRGVCLFAILLLWACGRDKVVQLSGRVEGVDSVIVFYVGEKHYRFNLDKDRYFSGELPLEESTYAFVYPLNATVFLAPGEDLEISLNGSVSSSVQYKGSLGAINGYLKDRLKQQWLGNDIFQKNETDFVSEVQSIIDRQILLLEAKNLGEDFTFHERERIRYCYAKQVLYYPQFHYKDTLNFSSNGVFDKFVDSFSIDNDNLLIFSDFKQFALNYVYYRGKDLNIKDFVEYILRTVKSDNIREYLLSEVVYRHFWENGLEYVDYLLPTCWQVVKDSVKMERINGIVDRWRQLSTGVTAPALELKKDGKNYCLRDFAGSYVYICVWSAWSNPWKAKETWNDIIREFKGKNIRFLTCYMGGDDREKLAKLVDQVEGEHFIINDVATFRDNYMVNSLPRYLFLDPSGRIVSANAVAPSESMKLLFRSVGL